jgi:hypothetical protein
MKQLLIFVFTLISATVNGQVNIYNVSLTDTTKNIFYIGVENKIIITGKEYNDVTNAVHISGGGASIYKESVNNYIVRVTSVTDECKILVTGKKGKMIVEKIFTVKLITDPVLQFGSFRNNETASVNEILNNPFLNVVIPDCYYQYNIQIVSFEIGVSVKDSVILESTTGNKLSDKQKELISSSDDNNMITVENIRVLRPDGSKAKLPSLVIYIRTTTNRSYPQS